MQKPSTKAHRETHQKFRVDINKIRMVSNHVLCKRLTHNIDEPIKGIYYPPSKNKNADMVKNADLVHEVVRLPDRLVDNRHVVWNTEIELREGDLVWTDMITALNAPEIEFGGEVYRMIRYHKIVVAKRDGKPIPVNGNLLMENFYSREPVGIDFKTMRPKYGLVMNYALAWVKFKGKKNKGYVLPVSDDGKDVKKGSLVILNLVNKNINSIDRNYIEHDMRAMFAKERYFTIKRKDILAVLEKEDIEE